MPQRKAIIFDRDGTLIIDKLYLNDPDQIEYLPDVIESLQRLRDAGYAFAVATNQSGVARGIVTLDNLSEIHRRIKNHLALYGIDILGFYYAPFMSDTDHYLRKPNAGMIEQFGFEFNIDLKKSWMIGDRMTDVEAGHRAGCRSILLEGTETPQGSPYPQPEAFVSGLKEMTQFILANS